MLFTVHLSGHWKVMWCGSMGKECRVSQAWVCVSALSAPSFISCVTVRMITVRLSAHTLRVLAGWILRSSSGPQVCMARTNH